MKFKLIKGSHKYKSLIIEMLEEWKKYNDTHDTNKSPYAIFKNSVDDFDYYIENLECKTPTQELVPDSTYFCLDEESNIIVGSVNIRHYLNEHLLNVGGHIGYGIRPSLRKKGYGSAMLNLALNECKNLGIDKVLLVCDKNNIASAKTITNNGGMLENEVEEKGKCMQRYWISIKKNDEIAVENK